MKTEQQVCTIEQAKRLKELGVIQPEPCALHWDDMGGLASGKGPEAWGNYAALTVAELGVMIIDWIDHESIGIENNKFYIGSLTGYHDTEASCRAQLLIYALENKFLTAAEVNERLAS